MTVALLSFFQPERECFSPNVLAVLYYPGLNMTDLPQACCTSSILMLFPVPFPQASLTHTALLSGSHKRCSVPVQKHLHLHAAQPLLGMWVFKQCLLMLSYPRETLLEMEARWEKRQWSESENPEKGSSFIIVTKTPRIALWELNNSVPGFCRESQFVLIILHLWTDNAGLGCEIWQQQVIRHHKRAAAVVLLYSRISNRFYLSRLSIKRSR